MNGLSGDRYRGGSSAAYSPLMRQPEERRARRVRTVLALALTFLCPPLGILYMWRAGVFDARLRVLLSALAGIELGVIFFLSLPKATLQAALPTPGSPSRVTAVSQTEVVTALSNIDELLGLAEEPAETTAPETAEGLLDGQAAQSAEDAAAAQQQAILDTTVYAVNSGAKYYHVSGQCRDQVNRRQLTVREAISEGLKPCSRCNPPRI